MAGNETALMPGSIDDNQNGTNGKTYKFPASGKDRNGKGVESVSDDERDEEGKDGGGGTDLTKAEIRRRKRSITKSQWAVNIAFFLSWTSIAGLTIIQSTVIGLEGTIGLSLNFAASIFGATLVAPLCIRFLGCKKSMVIGLVTVMVYESSNFYPHWGTIVPGGIISGLGIGPMFAAQGTYLTQQGISYAALTGEDNEAVIGRFFGLFFCVFLSSVSIGCLVTSAVLSAGASVVETPVDNSTLTNLTSDTGVWEQTRFEHCGANYCPWTHKDMLEAAMANLTGNHTGEIEVDHGVDDVTRYKLVGVHLAFAFAAVLTIVFFLDDLPLARSEKNEKGEKESAWEEAKKSIVVTIHQCRKPKQLLMMPLNIYIGMMQSYSLADLTEGYIGCALGVENMGYALMTYGFVAAVGSFATGLLLTKTGRWPLYTFANLLRIAVTITLLFWVPDVNQLPVFFILPALWAVSDSMLIALTNAFYGIMFSDCTDGAFSAYRFFEAVGFVIGYVYNQFICVNVKTYIMLGVHILGMVLYYATELLNKYETMSLKEKEEWKQSIKYIISFLRPRGVPRTKFSIQKSTWTMNMAFFLSWTSISGLTIIQGSVIGLVGTVGLSLNFFFSIIGATLIAPMCIRLIGCKKSVAIGLACVMMWELSNLYPHWGTMIPTSVITGVAMGPMFAGQGTYLTQQGLAYAGITGEDEEAVIGRFFGLFFSVFLSSVSVGCLVTSAVLSAGAETPPAEAAGNWTAGPVEYCGANYCPWTYTDLAKEAYPDYNDTQIQQVLDEHLNTVSDDTRYRLVGILTSFTLLASLLVVIFMDDLPPKPKGDGDEKTAWEEAKQSVLVTFKQCRRSRQLLMMPLNIYIGMMQSYSLADLTEGYIGCALGVETMGYALVTYGFVACGTSGLTGFLLKKTGRIPLYTFANLLRLGTTIALLLWVPDTSQLAVFFILPALWAISDSMLIALTNSFYGIMFSEDSDGAFSAYRFFEAIGFVIGYVYNKFICVNTKTYILLGFHVIGSVLYYVTEYLDKKVQRKKPMPLEIVPAWTKEGSGSLLQVNTRETNV